MSSVKCCGCIDLRTGCLILGYLSLIPYIIYTVLGVIGLIGGTVVTATSTTYEGNIAGASVIFTFIIMLSILLPFFILTVVLLVGLHQKKRGCIRLYTIFGAIFLVCLVIMFIVGITKHKKQDIFWNLFEIIYEVYYLYLLRSYLNGMDPVQVPQFRQVAQPPVNPYINNYNYPSAPVNLQSNYSLQNAPVNPQTNHSLQNAPVNPQINYNHQSVPVNPQTNYSHQNAPIYPRMDTYSHQNNNQTPLKGTYLA